MVKILKRGKKNMIRCWCCDSLLEYEKSDVKVEQTDINEYRHYIHCPVCDEEVDVN